MCSFFRFSLFFFFFFQAEDGIRDYKVTGVQTCALPVPHESPAAPVQDWWTPHPTWPVLHPAVGRKPIDSASVCADHPAHRAARMASDVIKGAVPKRGETRSKKDLVVVFLWWF